MTLKAAEAAAERMKNFMELLKVKLCCDKTIVCCE